MNGFKKIIEPKKSSYNLTIHAPHDKLLTVRGRGVVANMRPCQGRDRGFEPRRSRQNPKEIAKAVSFSFEPPGPHRGMHSNPVAPARTKRDREGGLFLYFSKFQCETVYIWGFPDFE